MPILLGIFSSISSVFAAIVSFFARKLAVASASTLALLAITADMVVCITTAINAVANSFAFPPFLQSIGWFLPSNFSFCISTIFSSRTCRAAYDLAVEKLRLVNSAS